MFQDLIFFPSGESPLFISHAFRETVLTTYFEMEESPPYLQTARHKARFVRWEFGGCGPEKPRGFGGTKMLDRGWYPFADLAFVGSGPAFVTHL